MRHSESVDRAATIAQLNVSGGGIPKLPVSSGQVTSLGLAGDDHTHPNIHGGARQALLLITIEGIEELAAMGFAVYPGMLGENLTSQGLDRRVLRLGQRLRIRPSSRPEDKRISIIIELTKIRVPCRTLDSLGCGIQAAMYDPQVRVGDTTSPRWGLSGFYASVIQPGFIRQGDEITPA